MESPAKMTDFFANVETTKAHKGYRYSVGDALSLVILGSLCGLRDIKQIHQWASSTPVNEFLSSHFGIKCIPCYYWLSCLLKIIDLLRN